MPVSSITDSDFVAHWHTELERSSNVDELASAIDQRAGVVPWRHPQSPIPVRPVFLSSRTASQVAKASQEVVRLSIEECARRASEPAALAALLGVEPSPLLSARSSWNKWAASQARPDVVLSSGVPKVLECNIGSAIGGIEDTARLDAVFWSAKQVAGVARSRKLRSGRSLPARRELLAHMARDRGSQAPKIAVAGVNSAHFAEAIEDAARANIALTYVELDELVEDGGLRNESSGTFDIFLQKFIAAGAYSDHEPMGALEAAVEHDTTLIASPDLSSLLSNKKILAWLTESVDDLPQRDRDLVLQHIPWTAILGDYAVRRHGKQVDLVDLIQREQASFVLKPTDSFGGHGVLVGCEMDADEWYRSIDQLLGEPFIVQEYFPADKLPTSVWDGGLQNLELPHVISPFIIGGKVEGFFARFSRPGQGAVTSADNGACNTVFVEA